VLNICKLFLELSIFRTIRERESAWFASPSNFRNILSYQATLAQSSHPQAKTNNLYFMQNGMLLWTDVKLTLTIGGVLHHSCT